MKQANKHEQEHMERVAATGCVICRHWHDQIVPGQVHHIADGSNPRSHYMTACLCPDHHTGTAYGLHGRGVKQFCSAYKLPNEYYLMALQNQYIAEDMNT